MTVYKGYMYIAKANAKMFLLYVAIFFGITLMIQTMESDGGANGYQAERLPVAVVDEDGGVFAESLKGYLGQFHDVIGMENDISYLQERLFCGDVRYIVWIPEQFYETCITKGDKLAVTQVPGSYTAFYVNQQINSFLNNARTYAAAGFSEEETAEAAGEAAKVQVELLDASGNKGEAPAYIMYFRYLPYLFLGVLGYVVGSMIFSMRRGDLQKRMLASAVPRRRQSIAGLLACGTVALVLWGIVLAGALVLHGKELTVSRGFWYYLLNSFAILSVSVSISYLLGTIAGGLNALNGLVNVASLGMCFLGGAFVPLDIMGSGVKKAAQFLPVYWFETANELLGGFGLAQVQGKVLQAIGIQFIFAAAFVCITLALGKLRIGMRAGDF